MLRAAGFVLLGLGAVGAVIPVMPTTPFVLLAAGCFSSSPRMQTWLCKSRYFRAYIENYREGKGLARAIKLRSLCFLWGMLLISALVAQSAGVTIALGVVGAAVTIHIVMIRSRRG